MSARPTDGGIVYRSRRPDGPAFEGSYAPVGDRVASQRGSLEHWLTERYCLYSQSNHRKLYRAHIHHARWPLQRASAQIERNDMLRIHGIYAPGDPARVHYAKRLDVLVWSLEAVG